MSKQPPQSSHDSGSFLSGLGIGLLGGAVGYFLFATGKGEKFRQQLKIEWKDIQNMVHPEVEQKHGVADSLKDLLGTFFGEMLDKSREEQKAAEAEHEAKVKSKKSKKKLFKGAG
jgi:gas vesicle protein